MFGLEGLPALWLLLLGVVWALYLGLGGADLGASMLLRRFEDRRAVLRANGPTWQANDVWLVIAVAATLGAFPGWYAAWTSGLYGVVLVIILALIVRHAGVELVGHLSARAAAGWTWAIVVSAWVTAIGWGVVWAWMLSGALTVGTLACGLALALVCRVAGAAFLAGRVDERVTVRPEPAVAVAVLAGVLLGEPWLLAVGVALAAMLIPRLRLWAAGVAAALLPLCVLAAVSPFLAGVDLRQEAAGDYTLTIMTVLAAVFLPLILLAHGFAYSRFKREPGGLARLARRGLEQLR